MKRSISPIKHIPQRTCVACHQVSAKRGLIRLVRIADGSVEVDITGKKAGRGAYLCPALDCWEAGLKDKKLEYTLRTKLTEDNRHQLIEFGQSLTGIKQ